MLTSFLLVQGFDFFVFVFGLLSFFVWVDQEVEFQFLAKTMMLKLKNETIIDAIYLSIYLSI